MKLRLFYTVHARERMSLRLISEEEIVEALEQGEIIQQEVGKYEVTHGRVRIVFNYDQEEATVVIITTMHERAFQREVNRYARANNTSCRKATRFLKEVA